MSDVRKKEKPNLRKRSFLKILKLRGTRCWRIHRISPNIKSSNWSFSRRRIQGCTGLICWKRICGSRWKRDMRVSASFCANGCPGRNDAGFQSFANSGKRSSGIWREFLPQLSIDFRTLALKLPTTKSSWSSEGHMVFAILIISFPWSWCPALLLNPYCLGRLDPRFLTMAQKSIRKCYKIYWQTKELMV